MRWRRRQARCVCKGEDPFGACDARRAAKQAVCWWAAWRDASVKPRNGNREPERLMRRWRCKFSDVTKRCLRMTDICRRA